MTLATVNEAIREMAWNIGNEYSEQAWLLSDYDVWTANPHYNGPPQPHPEDDSQYYNEDETFAELDEDFEIPY